MTKDSQPRSTVPSPLFTHSNETTHTTVSRSGNRSPFSSIGRAAKKAVEPTKTLKDRTVGHGLAAIFVEGNLISSGYLTDDGDDDSVTSPRNRRRDKLVNLFRTSSPELRSRPQSPRPQSPNPRPQSPSPTTNGNRLSNSSVNGSAHRLSSLSTKDSQNNHTNSGAQDSAQDSPQSTTTTSAEGTVEIEEVVSRTAITNPFKNFVKNLAPKNKPSTLPPKLRLDVFQQNISRPAVRVPMPMVHARISTTPQLALCIGLLPMVCGDIIQLENTWQVLSSDSPAQLEWVKAMKQDAVEQDHIRSLGVSMVEEFTKDILKNSVKVAEMVLLGPVLDKETFQSLLKCNIAVFERSTLLDVDQLQSLVQLVQSAPPASLLPDNLVKILSLLRLRLQDTHQQSVVNPFHLTLAVSRVFDVMADHKVEEFERVVEHENLSGALSGLKECSSPYVMYQACYAFQALQYISHKETPLHAVFRHSAGAAGGLFRGARALKLDLGEALEGLKKLHERVESTLKVAGDVREGVSSVMESGRGVFDRLREGLESGEKHVWYVAIRVAHAFVQAGQLKDLNRLIGEAPCRRDPLFQWGICQLLGEIATDVVWDTVIRQQAVDFLGELYKNDQEWGQDDSVNTWMLDIIRQLGSVDDWTVSSRARNLLEFLKQEQDTTASLLFPLRNRLQLPTYSPTLARVLGIPDVEYDLYKLRLQRLVEHKRGIYIPPQAKPNLQATDDNLFPLMEKALEFLASHRQVFLVLGDSGAGKSTFNLELEYNLWKGYNQFGPIPLYINLPAIDDPTQDLVEKQLQYLDFTESQILEMKVRRQFVLICDGYDESQLKLNLHTTNQFNQAGQWNVKVIISCRSQYLGQDYRPQFQPRPANWQHCSTADVFQEAVVAAFSRNQIQQYVDAYVKELPELDPLQNRPSWTAKEYMDKLIDIPNLMELVSNPLLLSLSLDALPAMVESEKELSAVRITSVQLYDSYVKRWLEINRMRLEESPLSDAERSELDPLLDDDFFFQGIQFQRNLAMSIFLEHSGNPVVKYTHFRDKNTWKATFFAPDGQAKLLRESSMLIRSGVFFRFLHRSLLEYFYSRTIYDPLDYDSDDGAFIERDPTADPKAGLSRMSIIKEVSTIQFLAERVRQDVSFRQQLLDIVDESKADVVEEAAKVAAANAISILVKAGVLFNGADLRGVRIPGADLSNGQFDSAQLQGAELRGVNFSSGWLRKADVSDAQMENVRFGELPYLDVDHFVKACVYSPDGGMIGVTLWTQGLDIYSTATWTRIHRIRDATEVLAVAFSPDSQQFAHSGEGNTVQLRDVTTGKVTFVMKGHKDNVKSIAFSPNGKQIASSGGDGKVRLWDSQTGENLFVLKGHSRYVMSVKYSPDGCQLVSGGSDGTIRFWDPETGEPRVVLSSMFGEVHSLAYSPDGKWVVSGHKGGEAMVWNAVTKEPGQVLRGHTRIVSGLSFAPNGQWIASSSEDRTVRLWDVSTGALVTIVAQMAEFNHLVYDVAFSPNGRQIASGGVDAKLSLWEVDSIWSRIGLRKQTGVVWKAQYSLDGQAIVTSSKVDHAFRRWDSRTGESESIPFKRPKSQQISSLEFSPDGKKVVVGSLGDKEDVSRDSESIIQLWDLQTGQEVLLGRLKEQPQRMIFSPCGRWLVFVDTSNTVRLWDLEGTEQDYVIGDESTGFSGCSLDAIAYSPSGHQVAMGSTRGTVWLFDTQSKELLTFENLIGELVTELAYSPSGQQLVLGSNGLVGVWNMQSDEPVLELDGANDVTTSVAYSPCGQWIAASSCDHMVRLWHREVSEEVESWPYVAVVRGFFDKVGSLSWNPAVPTDFVTICHDDSFRVWRVSKDDGGDVAVTMVWGSNPGVLCVTNMLLKDATGLSPVNQRLLMQREAVEDPINELELKFVSNGWS